MDNPLVRHILVFLAVEIPLPNPGTNSLPYEVEVLLVSEPHWGGPLNYAGIIRGNSLDQRGPILRYGSIGRA